MAQLGARQGTGFADILNAHFVMVARIPAAAPPSLLRFPEWQGAYEATLEATDKDALFKLVEIAESAILVRRDAVRGRLKHRREQQAIEDALRVLTVIKAGRLKFPPDDCYRDGY
jgi:hypothetical protein